MSSRDMKGSTLVYIVAGIIIYLACLIPVSAKAIIGGENTAQYSWTVAFVQEGSTPVEQRIICSGVLIKPDWVITAAHCELPAATTQVVIGRQDLSVVSGQKRNIAQHIRHPNYEETGPKENRWDIMLIRLDSSSTLDDMDLGGSNDEPYWGPGTDVRTYGYGRPSNSTSYGSKYSRRAEFRINTLTSDHYRFIHTWEGRTACFGDSGGPVITSTPSGAKQVGVTFVVDVDPSSDHCITGHGNFQVKTGYRSTSTNSPIWYWIVDNT